jgi:hypothetical protein
MGLRHFRGDVELLREALSLIREFGLHSVERLAHVAEFLERSVYAPRSLHAVPGGAGFTLLNPPLRVGAFSAFRVSWDGVSVPAEQVLLRRQGQAIDLSSSEITVARPIELRPGQRVEVRVVGVPISSGRHRVRIELQSIAVPPLVWFEFVDPVDEQGSP